MILQELSDQISDLRNTSDSCRLSCEEEKRQMAQLRQKKMKLEALVNDFQDNNEEYMKNTKTVEEKLHMHIKTPLSVLWFRPLIIFHLSVTEQVMEDP